MKRCEINQNDAGQRLDKYLVKRFPSLPRSLLYKALRKKQIKRNGKRAQQNEVLAAGDVVELYLNNEVLAEKRRAPAANGAPLDSGSIIYEDQNLIIFDKAPGLSVQSGGAIDQDHLVGRLQAYLIQKGEYAPAAEHTFAPAVCNRLDKNTGGIVLAAKNAVTLRAVNEMIRNNEIEKRYLLLAEGRVEPASGLLTAYHTKDTKENKALLSAVPRPGYQEIRTQYQVLCVQKDYSLVEALLLTGRFHQLRAQFAFLGHPLAGDKKYGARTSIPREMMDKKSPARLRQALYAYQIRFCFSGTGPLDYLKGRTFQVPCVPFCQLPTGSSQ